MLAGCTGDTGATTTGGSTGGSTTSTTTSTTTDSGSSTTTSNEGAGKKVGVSMPTKDLQRWNQDGANMESELKAAGYEVDLQYAANDVQQQLSQIENMIAGGCDVVVIAAIEGSSLGEALDMAKASNIPVIAYDRLLMNSDAVSYYATFDNYKVGTVQGTYVKDTLDLDNAAG
ncbi:MAG: substrate-binding domain-containing protein, partial [Lachnospiraceae bacterium]|nr:substrate-binding domain-containing protein [Lachnospiraceae bacterium]